MGIVAPRTIVDRAQHMLSGTVYDLDGDVMLEATNLFFNWPFKDIDLDDNPEGLVVGMPETPDEMVLYISKPALGATSTNSSYRSETAAASTLASQAAFSIDDEFLTGDAPWVPGNAPPGASTAAPIAPPTGYRIVTVPKSKVGFRQGTYYLAFSFFDKKKRSTPLSAFSKVDITSDGQQIKVTTPSSIPDGAKRLGVWLSERDKGPGTARLQMLVKLGGYIEESFVLKGPYRTRKPGPADNRTRPPKPKKPKLKKARGHGLGRSGVYTAEVVFVDEDGLESEPSELSDPVVVTDGEAQDYVHLAVEWGDASGADDAHYRVYVYRDGDEDVRYLLEDRSTQGGSGAPHKSYKRPTFSGRSSEESDAGERHVLSRMRHQYRRLRLQVHDLSKRVRAQEAGPRSGSRDESRSSASKDGFDGGSTQRKKRSSGGGGSGGSATSEKEPLEAPDEAPEAIVIGSAKLETRPTGTTYYWVTFGYSVRGQAGPTAPADRVALAPGETVRLIPEDPVNALRNSQFRDIDADGYPEGWGFQGVGGVGVGQGSFSLGEGVISLTTNGPRLPSASPAVWGNFSVNRSRDYVIGGTISCELNQGVAHVYVEEYSDDEATTLVTGGSFTLLKEVSAPSGSVDFSMRFGPTADAALGVKGWNDQTQAARVTVRFYNAASQAVANRDGTIDVIELYASPHDRRLRRYTDPEDYRETAEPDPPAYERWNKYFNKAVGPPPGADRRASASAPLAKVDFGTTTPGAVAPSGWAQRILGTTGMTANVEAPAAIDPGGYGLHLKKATSATGLRYIYRSFGATRSKLAARAKFRVRQLPTRGEVALLQIKDRFADTGAFALGYVTLNSLGQLYLWAWKPDPKSPETKGAGYGLWVGSGIQVGDVLDLELVVSGGGTNSGGVAVAIGKNGARRRFSPNVVSTTWWDTYDYYASVVQAGPSMNTDPATLWDIDLDTIVVTETGDVLTDPSVRVPYEASPKVDRPRRDPTILETLSFDSSTSLPASPWGSSRSPSDSTTALVVQAASKISATGNGLRVMDNQTTTDANAYIYRPYSPTREALGVRARFRLVTRPTTGTVRIMTLRDASSREIAAAVLSSGPNNTATVSVVPTSYDGDSPASVGVFQNLVVGSVFTLELVAEGAGTQAGLLSVYGDAGGTLEIENRDLYGQPAPLDWSTSAIGRLDIGLQADSINGLTAALDIDDVVLTEDGELLYRELTEDGETINQVWTYYTPGGPVRDDLWIRDVGFASLPGKTHTISLWARYAEVVGLCFPLSLTAYGASGTPYDLGCVFGDDGISGTAEWEEHKLTFAVPATGAARPTALGGGTWPEDCYEVWVDSPGISSGEFVAQELVISPGAEAVREVSYPGALGTPGEGVVWVTLDSGVALDAPEVLSSSSFLKNRWLKVASVADIPGDADVTFEYGSSDPAPEGSAYPTTEPEVWLPSLVGLKQRRYLHVRATLHASSDGKETPVIAARSPYLEYGTYWSGEFVNKLLRADGTEFTGGCLALGVEFPSRLAEYDIRAPQGRLRRHQRTEKIGQISGMTLRVLSEDAKREIEETCLDEDFLLEAYDRRFTLRFGDQILFDRVEGFGDVRPAGRGYWRMHEAEAAAVEIVETTTTNMAPEFSSV